MIIDAQLRFSGAIADDASATVTGQGPLTATAISTNVIDLRAPGSTPALVDEAVGEWNLDLIVKTIVAGAAGTSLTVTLESDSTADLATSATVHASSGTILTAALTANKVIWRTKLPFGDYERYLGLRYTIAGAMTGLTVESFLTPVVDRNIQYPNNYTIDA
mgnify:CR=1 FL=1